MMMFVERIGVMMEIVLERSTILLQVSLQSVSSRAFVVTLGMSRCLLLLAHGTTAKLSKL